MASSAVGAVQAVSSMGDHLRSSGILTLVNAVK
jgi:hypothetical protein